MDQGETWQASRPRPWPHCVRWGPSSTSLKGAQPPKILAHICCGHMAGWIKMPLAMEVGLGPDDFVLDGDPAPPPQKGRSRPIFGPCLLWPNGWMDRDATWYGSIDLGRGHIVVDCVPALRERGTAAPPSFRPMSVVATVAHLSYC